MENERHILYTFLFCLWFKEILLWFLFAFFKHYFSSMNLSLQKKAQIPVEDFFQGFSIVFLLKKYFTVLERKDQKRKRIDILLSTKFSKTLCYEMQSIFVYTRVYQKCVQFLISQEWHYKKLCYLGWTLLV